LEMFANFMKLLIFFPESVGNRFGAA